MSDTRPIGVFDSGLGGLTVVRELNRLMPCEEIVYLGDTARVPYGGRSEEVIRGFALQDTRFLMAHDIKLLVVACNTVSSVALEHIRAVVTDVPVIGVVFPGSKAAVTRTAQKKIGVIGTRATIAAGAYTRTIQSIDPGIAVFGKACPLFVPLVEEGLGESEICRLTARHYLYELMDTGIDCLILGCTHYPLLMEVITDTVGIRVHVLDSALWTAREAHETLAAIGELSQVPDGFSRSRFFVTDLTPNFGVTAAEFLGRELPRVEKIDLEKYSHT